MFGRWLRAARTVMWLATQSVPRKRGVATARPDPEPRRVQRPPRNGDRRGSHQPTATRRVSAHAGVDARETPQSLVGQDQPDSPVHFHAERLPVTDRSPQERIARKSRRGFRGYPIATIAWYGPDISRASKVVVGIVREDRGDVVALRKWFASMLDARQDEVIGAAILHFLQEQGVQSVVMSADLLGCPHEEGIDYPEGHECPACPYWAGRGRPI